MLSFQRSDNMWQVVARFICNFPNCALSFSTKQNLLRHQTQKHGRQKSRTVGQTRRFLQATGSLCDGVWRVTFAWQLPTRDWRDIRECVAICNSSVVVTRSHWWQLIYMQCIWRIFAGRLQLFSLCISVSTLNYFFFIFWTIGSYLGIFAKYFGCNFLPTFAWY